MSNELTGFFKIIMGDSDDRERVCADYAGRHPERAELMEPQLTVISNIKRLTLTRARQFGIVVNDDQQMLKDDEEMGVADMESYTQQLKKMNSRNLIRLGDY